jgi:hypothetical protein
VSDEQAFDAWAPPSGRWSAWVKPLLFAAAHPLAKRVPSETGAAAEAPDPLAGIASIGRADGTTAIIVDLPAAAGVHCGVHLAEMGYHPVPLYTSAPAPNGWPLIATVIDMGAVVAALQAAGGLLNDLRLPDDAPPAFLLDARRRGRWQVGTLGPGTFDNRSISLPTDFPSANLLLSFGIQLVVLIQHCEKQVEADLAHTLRRWQEAGLAMSVLNTETGTLQPLSIPRPPRFRLLWHGLLARLGLRRSPLGGYGGYIPQPSAG